MCGSARGLEFKARLGTTQQFCPLSNQALKKCGKFFSTKKERIMNLVKTFNASSIEDKP